MHNHEDRTGLLLSSEQPRLYSHLLAGCYLCTEAFEKKSIRNNSRELILTKAQPTIITVSTIYNSGTITRTRR